MKITFAPNNYAPDGIVSFANWENRFLQQKIREAFRESPREQITELVIDRDGIRAVFEPSNVAAVPG